MHLLEVVRREIVFIRLSFMRGMYVYNIYFCFFFFLTDSSSRRGFRIKFYGPHSAAASRRELYRKNVLRERSYTLCIRRVQYIRTSRDAHALVSYCTTKKHFAAARVRFFPVVFLSRSTASSDPSPIKTPSLELRRSCGVPR